MGDAAPAAAAQVAQQQPQQEFAPVSRAQGLAALNAITMLMETEAKEVDWGIAVAITQYPSSYCYMDCPKHKCIKMCCYLNANSVFATRPIPSIPEPLVPTDKSTAIYCAALAKKRTELQRDHLKSRLKILKSMRTREAATTSTWLGEPCVTREYAIATVAQQIMTQSGFRWFAGFSHAQIDYLRTSGAVHPNILPQCNQTTGRFSEDAVNPLHLKSEMGSMQKFLVLAHGGRIVHAFNHPPAGSPPQDEDSAKLDFETVQYVQTKNQDGGWGPVPGYPLDWGDHSAICEKFYMDVVIGDEREPYAMYLQEFEGIESVDARARLRDTSYATLKGRAKSGMKENLKREKKNELLNEVQIASLTTFHAIVDSGTESGVLDAAAKLWATSGELLEAVGPTPCDLDCDDQSR
jgi:hypothetical protein